MRTIAMRAAVAATILLYTMDAPAASIPDGDWRTINRDLASTRYSPLADQVNRANVAQLALGMDLPAASSYNTAVPLVIGGIDVFPRRQPHRRARFADTGKEVWVLHRRVPRPRKPAPSLAAGPQPSGRRPAGRYRLHPRRELLAGRRQEPRRASSP
jgi:glucose dehydrogenase